MNNLRIRRLDSRNLVIEARTGNRWTIIGYYGSPWAVANALVNQVTDCPDAETLTAQLDALIRLLDERTDSLARQLEGLLQRDPAAIIELDLTISTEQR